MWYRKGASDEGLPREAIPCLPTILVKSEVVFVWLTPLCRSLALFRADPLTEAIV
ncbi:hypothetical protein [uncultured Sulfitobacter sp.]|uniref:hypothetical protein n=1 Tax=uncultured Sulfitobacter sp. TaxID=191468 RepID=UPI002635E0E3|nr:hypothetical protein [uncultured Sulfitobacter sp.]